MFLGPLSLAFFWGVVVKGLVLSVAVEQPAP